MSVCRHCSKTIERCQHGNEGCESVCKQKGFVHSLTASHYCAYPISSIHVAEPESGNPPTHVCGLEGYGAEGDSCPACEWSRAKASGNQPQKGMMPTEPGTNPTISGPSATVASPSQADRDAAAQLALLAAQKEEGKDGNK